eukprot:3217288-Rhodomonas_salina.1
MERGGLLEVIARAGDERADGCAGGGGWCRSVHTQAGLVGVRACVWWERRVAQRQLLWRDA